MNYQNVPPSRLPVLHTGRAPCLAAICVALLMLAGCASESSDNPFDVSGYSASGAKEPFSSTVYPEPDILTQDSVSTYQQASYQGQAPRTVFDRRSSMFSTIDTHLYSLMFANGHSVEAAVNAEFGSEANARIEAEQFGFYLGQLPVALLGEIEQLWIHKGQQLWGSVNKALYVHTDMSANYAQAGILEETLVHEAVHVALDENHENTQAWIAAQVSDDNFISSYAKANALTEDLAESFLMWMASRYRADALSQDNVQRIEQAIPARLTYLDAQNFDMSPLMRR